MTNQWNIIFQKEGTTAQFRFDGTVSDFLFRLCGSLLQKPYDPMAQYNANDIDVIKEKVRQFIEK